MGTRAVTDLPRSNLCETRWPRADPSHGVSVRPEHRDRLWTYRDTLGCGTNCRVASSCDRAGSGLGYMSHSQRITRPPTKSVAKSRTGGDPVYFVWKMTEYCFATAKQCPLCGAAKTATQRRYCFGRSLVSVLFLAKTCFPRGKAHQQFVCRATPKDGAERAGMRVRGEPGGVVVG
jgi:hypothetical protein